MTIGTSPVLDLPFGSTNPIDVPVNAGDTNGVDDDPTTQSVSYLLAVGRATPLLSDPGWTVCGWNTDRSRRRPVYNARFTPPTVTQGVTYALWVKVGTIMEFSGFVRWS